MILNLKARRGWGWVTNPRQAVCNRIYNRTTVGFGKGCVALVVAIIGSAVALAIALGG